ncbi:hypothetical protein BHE74_00046274 [Ensete ventricosum]|nr:hypothetical protein BHE74_00046274 [Ensete ventricosum]RZS14185.1 hypothetical protein BHM03_00045842 [Ensete ventricosum]
MGKSSDRDSGVEQGKKGNSIGVIGSCDCGRSTTATEGRSRVCKREGSGKSLTFQWLASGCGEQKATTDDRAEEGSIGNAVVYGNATTDKGNNVGYDKGERKMAVVGGSDK